MSSCAEHLDGSNEDSIAAKIPLTSCAHSLSSLRTLVNRASKKVALAGGRVRFTQPKENFLLLMQLLLHYLANSAPSEK